MVRALPVRLMTANTIIIREGRRLSSPYKYRPKNEHAIINSNTENTAVCNLSIRTSSLIIPLPNAFRKVSHAKLLNERTLAHVDSEPHSHRPMRVQYLPVIPPIPKC